MLSAVVLLASVKSGRHLEEIGFLVGGLGALALLIGGFLGLQGQNANSRRNERFAYMAAGLLIGIGFLLALIGMHTATK